MATLRDLELFDHRREDSVAILVGPNGSGKSTFLRALAESYCYENVIAVSNTPHDRFARMRGIRRISAGRSDHTPPNLVKRAVARALDADDSSFHQISATMDYCGYASRFGFRIEKAKHYGSSFDDLRWTLESAGGGSADDDVAWDVALDYDEELRRALAFLKRHDPRELVWIDASRSAFEFSLAREFVAVLRCEVVLRRLKVIGRLEVMLQRDDQGDTVIEMHRASSGQLALISSLLFLITEAGRSPIILVDEPENSLHPSWQREYVDKLMTTMAYRDATLIVATHAPLVVTGALSDAPSKVSVFRVRDGQPTRLEINASAAPNSIEETLWDAFGVVTPANHFVSEEIVRAISRFEGNEIGKEKVLELIGAFQERSFDDQQQRFFEAVRKLVDKVERAKAGIDDGDDGFADPYVPGLDTCVFTDDEKAAIAAAIATEKPWDWKPGGAEEASLVAAKVKIRDLHRARHGDRCCYCRFPLHGGGHFIVDPEHVLPKSRNDYRPLAYTVWNLGIACKRCNMQYKRAKIDFVIDAVNAAAFQDSANYRLIHPNFDLYKEHISIAMVMNDDTTLIKYTKQPGSDEGPYTYDYFNLREREVGTFDTAQGLDVPDELEKGAIEAQELARHFSQ